MKDITSFFVDLFQGLKLPVRWLAFISLIILIIAGIWGYEQLTGRFYLTKLERKVALLRDLQTIAIEGTDGHPELAEIYEQAASELSSFDIHTPAPHAPAPADSVTLGKAISGAFLWVAGLVASTFLEIRKNRRLTGMVIGRGVALLPIAALFAWIGTLIPTLYNPWVNYLLFPWVQFAVLFLLLHKKMPSQV